jgi:Lrp/AsnC family transcriptional regulator for asnA, asnC and gidA
LQGLPKIDEIDAKILRILLAESRTSFTDIANECKITVSAVRMRYKRLWREGVINGEVTLVNPHCLGYRHIIDLGIIASHENEKAVAGYLESKPYVSQVVRNLGKYNFYGKVALRDLNNLSKIIEDLESNQKIEHVDALIWAEAVNIEHPKNIIIRPLPYDNGYKNNQRPALTDLDQTPIEIDDTDRKIALLVSRNARTPFRKIGAKLDTSTKTVIQRYKRLRQNLLTLSTITVDLNKLGYNALANLYVKVSNRSKMTDIYSQLLHIPNLIVIIRLIGSYDLYISIILEDFDRLFKVQEQIHKINGLEMPDVFITPMMPSWPLNLFPSLLENEAMMPKYWSPKNC